MKNLPVWRLGLIACLFFGGATWIAVDVPTAYAGVDPENPGPDTTEPADPDDDDDGVCSKEKDAEQGTDTGEAPPAGSGDSTGKPIVYFNGRIHLTAIDIPSVVGDPGFAHTRSFNNRLKSDWDSLNGFNWQIEQFPRVARPDTQSNDPNDVYVSSPPKLKFGVGGRKARSTIARYSNGGSGAQFNPISSPRARDTMNRDTVNSRYKFYNNRGAATVSREFHDFTTDKKGTFHKSTDIYGFTNEVVSYLFNKPSEMQRVVTVGGTTTTYSLLYDYFDAQHTNAFKLRYVTLRKKVDTGSWVNIRRVGYVYYGAGESHGTLNDLKTATQAIPDGSGGWDDVATMYYRYYKDGDANGGEHLLKYVVNPESYRRLDDAVTDPLTASDSEVADHADLYFEYDSDNRVTKEVAKKGCGGCSGGGGGTVGDTFVYGTPGSNPDDYNNWKHKTTVTHQDGSKTIVYTNHLGMPILKRYEDGANVWRRWFQYSADGRVVLAAHPSAVGGDNESYHDLVNYGETNSLINATAGLIETRAYYAGTTATDTTLGGVENYLQHVGVKRGEDGTEIKVREYQWLKFTINAGQADEDFTCRIGKKIEYPDDSTTATKIETTYDYTFYSGTIKAESRTINHPAIASGQNGSGTSATTVEFFDAYGNLEWRKDPRGSITRYVYDVPTGKLTQRIDDVDTDLVTGEPSGWSSPNGLHLVRDYTYDGLSRLVEVLGPEHTADVGGTAKTVRAASWTVYDENGPSALDQTRSGSGYYDTAATAYTLVDPVAIRVRGKDGNNTYESILAKRSSGSGKLSDTDTFNQSDYQAWTVNEYSDDGRMKLTRRYHTIGGGVGIPGSHYDQTDFAYDADTGERVRVQTPDGTITRTVYATVQGRDVVAGTWVGTDDTGATASDPSGGGASGNNMKQVAGYEYDSGNDGGDGYLTKVTLLVNDTAADNRVTSYTYDFRGRRETADGEVDRFTKWYYDNLGRVTKVERYDTTSGGNLIARSETRYDDRHRVYQTVAYAVDPASGTVGNGLTGNTWYDDGGNVLKSQPPGKVFTKHVYDGLGRLTRTYTGYDTDETPGSGYADADDVVGDTLVGQSEYSYDDASNVLAVTSRRRLHDATGTGELTTPSGSQPQARVTHTAYWYDGADRPIASADYGTNADAAFTRPTTTPAASDTVLVSLTAYDDAGRADTFTDPEAVVTKVFFDDAGRQTHVVENYVSTGWVFKPSMPGTRNADVNRVTAYSYTAGGQIATLTALDPDHDGNPSDNQVTTYVYGVTSGGGSDLASNRLLRAVIYPDSDDPASGGDGTDGVYDRVELTYNRLGQPKSRKDPREAVHTFDYDDLGRLLHDRVTSTGRSAENVDNATLRITRAYEVRGMLDTVTSYDHATPGSGTALNQVDLDYNNFGQLTSDAQEHSGTASGGTPGTTYAYEDGSDATKVVRLNKVTYPNARDIHYLYADAGDTNGVGHVLGRVTALSSGATRGTSDANVIAGYTYLGPGSVVRKDYPLPDLHLDYIGTPGSGDGGYANLDRFGRVTAQQWEDYSGASDVDVFHIAHGYDRASNRLYADRKVYQSYSQHYAYDDLHRLKTFNTGQFDSTNKDIQDYWDLNKRNWTLDQLGNQLGIQTPEAADYVKNTPNQANEYTAREVTGDVAKARLRDDFDTDSSANWTKIGTDSFTVDDSNSNVLTFSSLANDSADTESAGLLLLGEDIGPAQMQARVEFTTAGGQAGLVFGYKSDTDYWLLIADEANDKREMYHVHLVDSVLTKELVASVNATYNTGTEYTVFVGGVSNGNLTGPIHTFTDGFPSGRVGIWTNSTDVEFNWFFAVDNARLNPLTDRWVSPVSNRIIDTSGDDRLSIVNGVGSGILPTLLKGVRADRFEAIFSVNRTNASNGAIGLVFNATNTDDFDLVDLDHSSSPGAVVGYETAGAPRSVVADDGGSYASVPSAALADTMWYKVTSDGTTVKAYAVNSSTKPGSWGSTVFESSNFDMIGGMLGLVSRWYNVRVSDFELRTDRDANGSYETTEVVEDFSLDSNGYADAGPTHDAAGNLSYDGVYQYTYDAWNRLVTVTKAYRDSGGVLQSGSVVQESEYDGLGRRIVKAVKNSADLDATYHYYYTGWRLIETRNGSGNVLKQHVWGVTYIDELAQTALNDDPADGTEDDVESYYYALQDAHFNVLGMVSSTGALAERYEYTPYGERTVYLSPGSNDPDAMAPTMISRRWTVGSTAQPYGLNDIGHQGLMHDEDTGLIQNRARMRSPRLGRWLQREPLGYVDGMSLYQYVGSEPIDWFDPLGYQGTKRTGGQGSSCHGQGCLSKFPPKGGKYDTGNKTINSWGEAIDALFSAGPFDSYTGGYTLPSETSDKMPELAKDLPGNSTDALRHCYWSCRMAQEIGPEDAEDIGNGHEEWYSHAPEEHAQDYANNQHGRDCAEDTPPGRCTRGRRKDRDERIRDNQAARQQHCISCCREKWNDGTLKRGNP